MQVTISESLLYTLLGMLIVFFGLVCLMIVINLMAKLAHKEKNAPAETAVPAPAAAPAVPIVSSPPAPRRLYASGSAGDIKLFDVSDRDAAMIMAIMADELKMPLNEIRFKSIKEVKAYEV
jgi:Oxaloacetate decarboxylase, gamma chain.